jgi:DNA helicase-2/ATP-dependent DNA helicase PcrA
MPFIADMHIHSRFSRATSPDLDLARLHAAAQCKGVTVLGTGDFTHPQWRRELKEQLLPAGDGLYRLRTDLARPADTAVPKTCRNRVRFMLTAEISTIYKRAGRVYKIHHLICAPDLASAERLVAALAKRGNLAADGRPILRLDSRDLLEIALEAGPDMALIPAHIWTPWFSCLGSKSGFDSIKECYGSLAQHIVAVETGLSSDPPMNWRLSSLDRFALVSNSDAHSASKIAREANVFGCEISYPAMLAALRSRDRKQFIGTIEFFPEEGKYHLDGHRLCHVRLTPRETRSAHGLCPVCGKPITIGVIHRVEELADREAGVRPQRARDFDSLIPLVEILSEILSKGVTTKSVRTLYNQLLSQFGPELFILREIPLEDLSHRGMTCLSEALRRMRTGDVIRSAGYDGEYGTIKIFEIRNN